LIIKSNRDEMKGIQNGSKNSEFLAIPNPYHPHDFGSADWFYHKDVIKKIREIFNLRPEMRVIFLHGNPGSGKTSILKQIVNSSGLLGKNYVPIYLDSRKYMGLNVDDLSFSLYKDIAENLNQRGYRITPADFFRERRKKDNITTLHMILLSVDSYLKEEEVLVVIFDELDNLLEGIEHETISSLIHYFQNIEKSWSNYGLILAGDRRLTTLTSSEPLNEFLKMAAEIDLEEVLDEKAIKKLITEPLKNKLIFDEQAIEKIIWYCGKNLYFQQLICYYLVIHLNQQKRNHCPLRDVDHVIQQISGGSILEFSYAWENKLAIGAKLIASALADESVTEKGNNFYFLKTNSLLDDVFGKSLEYEIEKLKNFGHLTKMEKRRFTEFPFKIPLYGKWIQREHPFLKTIIQHIESIADKIDFEKLTREIKATPQTKLLPFDKKAILSIAEKWSLLSTNILKNRTPVNKGQVEDFFVTFCERINFPVTEKSPGDENYFIIDIKNLEIGILEEALCFIQDRTELTNDDISSIVNRAAGFAQKAQSKLTLFFYFRKTERVENLVKKAYLSLITIDENDLKKIILADRPLNVCRKIILSKLSLQKVSPYKIAGPAKAIFYGRSEMISRISGSTDNSFAIVGGRKIGKSSLLHKIKENPAPGVTYIYMDLEYEFSNVKSYRTFIKSLQAELERRFQKKIDFSKFPFGVDLSRIRPAIQELSQNGEKIVFIFDEMDGLIKFDQKHNFKLMRIFRTMSQKDYCQFIFAGFKELYHHTRDIENPFYNFFEEIILEPLEREAAMDLITSPMESIGVHYHNREDRELILGYTACHPNLLQFF
jgi:Cdc6-like AAA superfamily ATPase